MHTLTPTAKRACALIMALALAACGGGSSSSFEYGSVTYPLQTTAIQLSQNTTVSNYTYSGTLGGQAASGTGRSSGGTPGTGTFENTAALTQVTSSTDTLTMNGTSTTSVGASTLFLDYNYLPLGYSVTTTSVSTPSSPSDGTHSRYTVVSDAANAPTRVGVGSSGTFYTSKTFTDSSKTNLTGSSITTYSVAADTDQTALLTIATTSYDASSTVVATSTSVYRITTSGSKTRLSSVVTYPGGDKLTYVYQ